MDWFGLTKQRGEKTTKSNAENNYRRMVPVGPLPNRSKFLIIFLDYLESAPSDFIDTKIDKRKQCFRDISNPRRNITQKNTGVYKTKVI